MKSSLTFKIGHEYTYTFTNEVNSSNIFDQSNPSSYRLEGAINVASIWRNGDQKILQFRLISTKLNTKSQKTQEFDERSSTIVSNISPKPFFVVIKDGVIQSSYFENENESISNLKKAIISFFQYQQKDGTEKETDVSGVCDVSYMKWESDKFSKTKLHCRMGLLPQHQRLDYPLGVTVTPFSNTEYWTGVDRTVKRIEGHESYVVKVNAYPNVGTIVNSTFTFELNDAIGKCDVLKCDNVDECMKMIKNNVKKQDLISKVEKSCQDGKCYNLVQDIKMMKNDLKDTEIGNSASARAFVKLVPVGRSAKAETWHRIMNSQTGKEIKGQLLDILAAVQTYDAFKEATHALKFEKEEEFNLAERYLQGLSVGTRPDTKVIEGEFLI